MGVQKRFNQSIPLILTLIFYSILVETPNGHPWRAQFAEVGTDLHCRTGPPDPGKRYSGVGTNVPRILEGEYFEPLGLPQSWVHVFFDLVLG